MTSTGISPGIREPIYTSLAHRLRQEIRDGHYEPGQMLGSEHALAKKESISRMTVRRASEVLVREGLLERRPGKGLYVRSDEVTTREIQIVAGNLQWEPSLQASRGAQSIAWGLGIKTQLYDAHGDVEADLAMLRGLPRSQADGAIIVSLHSKAFNETIYELKRQGFPFVLVDQKLHDIDVASVTADNYSGGYQAGQRLIEAGHRRVAFMGDFVATTVRDRLAGFRDAVMDAGLPLDRSLLLDLGEDQSEDRLRDWSVSTEQCTRTLMRTTNPPTGIFFSCDAVARSGCRALQAMGFRVPEDVSIIGFDDDPLCQWMTPKLTSIRQPFFEMGKVALEMLNDVMAEPTRSLQNRVMPVKLVDRDSVAPPPATTPQ